MKILISGSLGKDPREKDEEEFVAACRQIGEALARNEIEIIVASVDLRTADRYVLEGAANVEGQHRVHVFRPDVDGQASLSSVPHSERLDVTYKRFRGSWWAVLVPQILAADAVVIIKGGSGALTTGYMAPALERPVVAVASLHGAAETLWREFQPYYDSLGTLSAKAGRLNEPWQKDDAQLVINLAKELVAQGVFRTKPRLPMGIYLTLLVSCLVGWVVLFVNPLPQQGYSFFSMLALAGLLGTILRNNLRLVFDPVARFSWNELLIEISTGLVLGFALALLYLIGTLTITGSADVFLEGGDKGFQRIAIVMTFLGLGAGLMIEQASDRVKKAFMDKFEPSKP